MVRLPRVKDTHLIMKNKRKNKLAALTKLLTCIGFILVLIFQLQISAVTQHFVHAMSLYDGQGKNLVRIRSADHEGGSPSIRGYLSLYPSDEDGVNNQDSDIQYNQQEFPSYPLITVTFVPPLVQYKMPENTSAIYQNVSIAKIQPEITLSPVSLTTLNSSNQTRSQLLKSIKHLSNDDNITKQFQIEFTLLNHQDLFAIDGQSGDIYPKDKPSDYTYILDVRVNIVSLPNSPVNNIGVRPFMFDTKAPVSIGVIDSNNHEPESAEIVLMCMAYDTIDVTTPICTPAFKDEDRGVNSELRYTLNLPDELESNETFNLMIDPITGSIFRRYVNKPLNPGMIQGVLEVRDIGHPFLESSIRYEVSILDSNLTRQNNFNEKPYLPAHNLRTKIILNGTEQPGTAIANLTPLDADGNTALTHIIAGDPNSLFAINAGSLITAKYIDFSEKRTLNLTLMVTDGVLNNYYNVTIMVPKIVKSIPNEFFTKTISMSNAKVATPGAILHDVAKYAFDTSFAKYRIYSTASNEARDTFSIDEDTGLLTLNKSINYKFNGHHPLLISIEDTRLSPDSFRTFVYITINVNLESPPPPPPPTTTTTTTTSTTTTSTTTTTTTTTPRPKTTSTTTTTTTTTTTPRPTIITHPPTKSSATTTSTTTTTTMMPKIVVITSPTTISIPSTSRPQVIHYPTQIPYQPNSNSNLSPNNISPNQIPPNQYDPYNTMNVPKYPPWGLPPVDIPQETPVYPPLPPPPPPPYSAPTHPVPPPPSTNPTLIADGQVPVKTLVWAVLGLMVVLFFLTLICLLCRCCCPGPKRKRYRDGHGALLSRSSFHSQQRLHGVNASPHVNGSMSRNMNSRLSLRTSGVATPASARGAISKYGGAGDSVSLSAMNERSSKHKALIPPPSPLGNQSSIMSHEGDDALYANAFGPGHPQYLNELRRLKPDYTRLSARLPNSKKPASSSNVNNTTRNSNDAKVNSKSSSALPSTPVRTSSKSSSQIKGKIVANHRPLPSKGNRSADLNSSRTTNTSANVSPSLNDNNSRTILLGSDDIRSPLHRPRHSSSRQSRQKFHKQVHTDSTADYDDVASHSTVDDTTPQTSSENASMSELPFEARFKTFVKQKKNKELVNPAADAITTGSHRQQQNLVERYDRSLPPAPGTSSEDTDNEPTTNLLSDYYADALPLRGNNNNNNNNSGSNNHRDSQYIAATNGGGADKGSYRAIKSTAGLSGSKTVLQNGTSEMNNNNINEDNIDTNDNQRDGSRDDDEEVENLYDDNSNNDLEEANPDRRRKRQATAVTTNETDEDEGEEESDDSADDEEDDEDAEEGVYDLGTSNLF